jgi:hypothetical protein
MKSSFCACLFLLVLLLSAASQAGMMETVPVGDEIYGWIYEYLDELYARGLINSLQMGTKPYFRGEIAGQLLSLRERLDRGQITLQFPQDALVHDLEREFSSEIGELRREANPSRNKTMNREFSCGLDFHEGSNLKSGQKTVFAETVWPYAEAEIGANFFACTRYMVDENLANDPDYTGKVWRGLAGDAAQAYLAFRLPYFKVLLGRERVAWGQRHTGELILSENAFPLDMVQLQGGWGAIQATAFFAFLSSLAEKDSPDNTTRVNRYLSGHRISLNLFSRAQLGFSETIIYGGEDRQVEAYYLNPLMWYHGAQLNENRDDNTFFAFDFNLRPRRNLLLYGELLIDDLQIENKSPADKEPNELGYTGGFSMLDPLGLNRWGLNLEYTRINNWTYNQSLERNRYLHGNRLLGNPLGPDADDLTVEVSTWWRKGLRSKISYSRSRRGEGRVDSPWTQPWMSSAGDYQQVFPSGVVQICNRLGLGWEYHCGRVLDCAAGWDFFNFENYQNVEAQNKSFHQLSLSLSLSFRGPGH